MARTPGALIDRNPHAAVRPGRALQSVVRVALAATAVGLFIAERRWPLRVPTQSEPGRWLRNLAMGAASLAVIVLAQRPLVEPLAERVELRRLGLAQRLPWPRWARDAAAFLLLDYTIYVWHVLTRKLPFLWRFHLVHHVDRDLDTTTALRLHAVDMAISIPWRLGQVVVCGAGPRAMLLWQSFFFVAGLFHHSNLRLPPALERRLAMILATPRMHGIHHSVVREETNANWSSGLSFWDRLHRTLRLDVPQELITIGVPGYPDPTAVAVDPSVSAGTSAPRILRPEGCRIPMPGD